jgi:sulfotransferase famil protein
VTQYFNNNLIIHTHIEKTAGSTLVRALMRALGKEHVHDLRPIRAEKPEFLDDEKKRGIYVLTGHFHYGTQDRYFARRKIYLACVRPPLSRYFSYYSFVRVRSGHPGFSSMQGKSFVQMVEEFLAGDRRRANAMARTITGVAKPDREQVLASAENNYAILTPHERVNDTLRPLISLTGGRLRRKELHMNRGIGETAEDIGILADRFNEANALDRELYDYVQNKYEVWLKNLDGRLSARSRSTG